MHKITPRIVHTANESSLLYVEQLARKHSNAIGFIPRAAMLWYIAHEMVSMTKENGSPCAYLLGRARTRFNDRIRPIYQAAVPFDAQMQHHGINLIASLQAQALISGQTILQCWCADDLPANAFWRAAGFRKLWQRDANNARGRLLNCWRKSLSPLSWQHGFMVPPPVAGPRAAKIKQLILTADSDGDTF